MSDIGFDTIDAQGGTIKAWTRGVSVEDEARAQLERIARLPCVTPWVAAMPDVHLGKGATVGSVIPTVGAIIPAAVGVDLGCGMMAVRTSLTTDKLPDNLASLRAAIEKAVPHGRTAGGDPARDRGAWKDLPVPVAEGWARLKFRYANIVAKNPKLARGTSAQHLGTLGTGNHFVEVCAGDDQRVWLMLHSGSRGVGNRIGSYFIERAQERMQKAGVTLEDVDLAWLVEGSPDFDEYVEAVAWAQDFAALNRELMMSAVVRAASGVLPAFTVEESAVNCHHNYVQKETHFGQELWLTRKGAVRAGLGELGIIPGSMGARSFITRGLGQPDSFNSSSHGAGRAMSRGAARKRFSLEDHARATAGVECRKDRDVLDETPGAYKPIADVMAAQRDLVEVVTELKQVVCVKG